jgi:hypothetical protein
MFFKIRCIGFTSWRSKFLGFTRSTLASHICSTDLIPWVNHSREEGPLDYDGGFVHLQVHLNFNTNIYRQHLFDSICPCWWQITTPNLTEMIWHETFDPALVTSNKEGGKNRVEEHGVADYAVFWWRGRAVTLSLPTALLSTNEVHVSAIVTSVQAIADAYQVLDEITNWELCCDCHFLGEITH